MTNAERRSRNIDIWDSLEGGESIKVVAERFELSTRQVRNIRHKLAGEQFQALPDVVEQEINPLEELGETGLGLFGGLVQEDFLSSLKGLEAVKNYNEMRLNSPVIGAMLFATEQAIRTLEWLVEPDEATEDEIENDERAELIETSMQDMSASWNDFIAEVLTMLAFGWSFFEIVYKRRDGHDGEAKSKFSDGRLGWRKFAPRGQDTLLRWELDESGGLVAFTQQLPISLDMRSMADTIRHIPIEKALLFRTRVEKNSPEGRSLLRTAWVPYNYVKGLQQIEAIGAERDIAGLPVITLPPSATQEQQTAAKEMGRRVRNDEQASVVINEGWVFELLSAAGSKQFNIGEIIVRYEKRMLMSMMAQMLLLGQDSVGSFALSQDQTDLFVMAVDGIADQIASVLNRFAIPRLLELNGMDLENHPVIAHTPVARGDLSQFAAALAQVANSGLILPDVELERSLRERLDLPPLTDEEVAERERKEEEAKEQIAQAQAGKVGDDEGQPPKPDTNGDDETQATLSDDGKAVRNLASEIRRLREEVSDEA